MDLTNTVRLSVPVEQAWRLLTDVERIAPCLPGARLTETSGDEYRGTFRIKVGPVVAQYRATASYVELDAARRVAVLKATGSDSRGQGGFSTLVRIALTPDEGCTRAELTAELTVTGKAAQFGRGLIEDVSKQLIARFAANLERELAEGGPVSAPPGERPPEAGAESTVDLGSLAGTAVLKRALPPAVALAAFSVLLWQLVRRGLHSGRIGA